MVTLFKIVWHCSFNFQDKQQGYCINLSTHLITFSSPVLCSFKSLEFFLSHPTIVTSPHWPELFNGAECQVWKFNGTPGSKIIVRLGAMALLFVLNYANKAYHLNFVYVIDLKVCIMYTVESLYCNPYIMAISQARPKQIPPIIFL